MDCIFNYKNGDKLYKDGDTSYIYRDGKPIIKGLAAQSYENGEHGRGGVIQPVQHLRKARFW